MFLFVYTKYTNCSRDLKWSVAFRASCVPQHGRWCWLQFHFPADGISVHQLWQQVQAEIFHVPISRGGSTAVPEPYISTLSTPGAVWLYVYGGLPDQIGAIFDGVILWTEQAGPLFLFNPLFLLFSLNFYSCDLVWLFLSVKSKMVRLMSPKVHFTLSSNWI